MPRSVRVLLGGLLLCAFNASTVAAQSLPSAWPPARYKVHMQPSVMVPMRDGVKLSTDLYLPEGSEDRFPVLLIRTPYNKKSLRTQQNLPAYGFANPYGFAGQGYIVAVQDTRGRFESEGNFTISFPDAEDGYDTTTWLANQSWSSGKIGTFGCSYVGDVQIMQARLRNSHLIAMIPQAAGSSFTHRGFGISFGGAVELAAGFGWMMSSGSKVFLRPPPGAPADFWAKMGDLFNPAPVDRKVDFREIWKSLPIIDMVKRAGGPPTDWEDALTHGPEAQYWVDLGYLQPTDRFDTPALQINSWYDFGVGLTLDQFNLMRTSAISPRGRDNQFFVISPTAHCMSPTATEHTVVGQRDLGDARFDYYSLYLRWFDYWLKGVDNGVTKMPKLQIYVMGKNQWRGESEWPLARTEFTKFFLRSNGSANSRLGTGTLEKAPGGDETPDQFIYDPGRPVQSVGGALCCTGTPDAPAGSYDQSDVERRPDVLVYTTPVLEKGVEVTGPVHAVLYVSSTVPDTDFTAKLVDVYPNGAAYNIQEGILRARYRDGWSKRVWMKPDEVYELAVDMEATSNYFGQGHRIRVEISSSNFPRFDRNLNTGGNNYDEVAWRVAKNTVHHSRKYPSHVVLPVIP